MKHRLISPRCAILTVLAALTCAVTPSQAQNKKPNILFIMGDDIGWMQARLLSSRPDVGETPNIDRHRRRGRACSWPTTPSRAAPPGATAFFTGMHPLRTGMILPQLPGSPISYLRPGTPMHRPSSSTILATPPASSARTISATIPRFAADGARLPGILGLPLSPGRHAAGQFPGHQQDPHRPGHSAAV